MGRVRFRALERDRVLGRVRFRVLGVIGLEKVAPVNGRFRGRIAWQLWHIRHVFCSFDGFGRTAKQPHFGKRQCCLFPELYMGIGKSDNSVCVEAVLDLTHDSSDGMLQGI